MDQIIADYLSPTRPPLFPVYCPNCQLEPCRTQIREASQWSSCPKPNIYETPLLFDQLTIRQPRCFHSRLQVCDIYDRAFIRVCRHRMRIIFEEVDESSEADGFDDAEPPREPPPKHPYDPRWPYRVRPMGTRRYKLLQGARNQKESLDMDSRADWRIYRIAQRGFLPQPPLFQPPPASIGWRMRWAIQRVVRRIGSSLRKTFIGTPMAPGQTPPVDPVVPAEV